LLTAKRLQETAAILSECGDGRKSRF